MSAAVSPISNAGVSAAAPASVFGTGGDFSMFLKLLTTQMQNQDPLNPMDSTQYTQQLAQYSQVEQSIQQTGLLKDVLAALSGRDLVEAAGLIGKDVEFAGATAALGEGSVRWSWSSPTDAAEVRAEIVNAAGVVVARPSVASRSGGVLTWDGTALDGGQAPPGAYTLRIDARDGAGATLPCSIRTSGTVAEVLSGSSGPELRIGGQNVPLSRIAGVRAGSGA